MLEKLGQKKYLITGYGISSSAVLTGILVGETDLSLLGMLGALTCTFVLIGKLYGYLRRSISRSNRVQTQISSHVAELRKSAGSVPSSRTRAPEASSKAVASRVEVAAAVPGVGPNQYYGSKHHRDIRVLESIAMRLRSVQAREPIALNASGMKLGAAELLTAVRGFKSGLMSAEYMSGVANWNPKTLTSLARVMADQSLHSSDLADACSIYHMVHRIHGVSSLDKRARLIYVEALQSLGRHDEASELMEEFAFHDEMPHQETLIKCNRIASESTDVVTTNPAWIDLLNSMYAKAGFLTLSVRPNSSVDALQNFYCQDVPEIRGVTVSVLMPTRNGSDRIGVAVESVLTQSWRNIELIIIDDASDEEHWKRIVEDYGNIDRVKLFRLEHPSGAYVARNYGLEHCTGEFVTVHDDDDWSHPQKIEIQVKEMLDNPDFVGCMSFQSRIGSDGQFLRINDNPEFNQRNYSSLLVRTKEVRQLGGWANLSRGADAEFHDRIKAITGRTVSGVDGPPMSFTKARQGSLTDGEISKGALDFSRQALGASYPEWHSRLRKDSNLIYHSSKYPYPVPESMIPGHDLYATEYDVVYATDFRFKGGNSSLVAQEIAAASQLGLRVAVAQFDSPVLRSRPPMNAKVFDTLMEHNVPLVSFADNICVSLLVLRHPTILQYAENIRSQMKVSRSVIVANNAPMGADGSDAVYDMETCVSNCRQSFGVEPEVVPESAQIRELLNIFFPGVQLSNENWPGFICDTEYHFERSTAFARMPVVGRHSRDHHLKWPAKIDDVVYAYIQPDLFRTKILGGADSLVERLGDLQNHGVEVLPFGSVPPSEFLKSVDFWIYFHHTDLTESFGMSIIEAMASGAVCILPAYMEPMFGQGAVYCEPESVRGVVNDLWSDKDRYFEQSQRGVNLVRDLYSVEAYCDRLTRFARSKTSVGVTHE